MDSTITPSTSSTIAIHYPEHHATEAAFLWMLRSLAVDQAQYAITDIIDLDQRLETNLDALMLNPEQGWKDCEALLATGGAGEAFTAMVIAIRSHNSRAVQIAVKYGLSSERRMDGLVSALGWLPEQLVLPWIDKLLHGKDMKHKYLGMAACSLRRHDPGKILNGILFRQDCRQHVRLYIRALRLIGELRRHDLLPILHMALMERNTDVRFWAAWSAILLGDLTQVEHLREAVFHRGPYQEWAIQLAFRVLGVELGREWINAMSNDRTNIRAVIKAIGVLGDPHAVSWLIMKMEDPMLARLAAEAFTSITGVNLEKYHLSSTRPADQVVLSYGILDPTHVGIDEDEDLPWPNSVKVAEVWNKYGQKLVAGQRYFMGRPISAEWLNAKLNSGTQRQRHAAALELALIEPNSYLINTRARITH